MFQGKKGLELGLRADPKVEAYFKEMAKDKAHNVDEIGNKAWYTLDDNNIEVWNFKNRSSAERAYTINYPGYGFDLNSDPGIGGNLINMSFLKIKGITEGVRIGVIGVMELQDRRELKEAIGLCMRMFVRDYLAPITLELKVVTRERWG
jgi:hypothetical protein